MHFRVRKILQVGLAAFARKEDVVLPPEDDGLWLLLLKIRLPLRIELDVLAVVIEEVELDASRGRSVHIVDIHVPVVRAEERVPINPSFVTNSADAAIEHAKRGGGLTMVLAYQVVDAVKNGKLQVVLSKYEPPPLPIQVVSPASRFPSANLKAFVEMVVATRKWNFLDL